MPKWTGIDICIQSERKAIPCLKNGHHLSLWRHGKHPYSYESGFWLHHPKPVDFKTLEITIEKNKPNTLIRSNPTWKALKGKNNILKMYVRWDRDECILKLQGESWNRIRNMGKWNHGSSIAFIDPLRLYCKSSENWGSPNIVVGLLKNILIWCVREIFEWRRNHR